MKSAERTGLLLLPPSPLASLGGIGKYSQLVVFFKHPPVVSGTMHVSQTLDGPLAY
jgi:hypothetical protein